MLGWKLNCINIPKPQSPFGVLSCEKLQIGSKVLLWRQNNKERSDKAQDTQKGRLQPKEQIHNIYAKLQAVNVQSVIRTKD